MVARKGMLVSDFECSPVVGARRTGQTGRRAQEATVTPKTTGFNQGLQSNVSERTTLPSSSECLNLLPSQFIRYPVVARGP